MLSLAKLKKNGTTIAAKILEVTKTKTKNPANSLNYSFSPMNSERITQKRILVQSYCKHEIFENMLKDIKVGDEIKISYLQNNPKNNFPTVALDNEIKMYRNILLIGLLMSATILIL